ncbi:hypothetical protein CLAFUW4_10257 [Fulvia fulva]|nr:hypothetical protein CLAFUR4_10261 [Fulvia fulva]KAK4616497.1 hypothetical protein CLAFUR0_10259 [Fulvia fulva]WPV19409.1 hypothetical protein CLAFUW4_10257 [Fulvia fulva]WPV34691.1 hypothetical protein CLAFUW7_10257 [Fulvia fulva]
MYFAIHILPPADRQRTSENAIRTVPVPIEGDKTFADLLQAAQARFEAISSPQKTELSLDTLADKHGAEMFASDKIESLFGSGQTGAELYLYTSKAFKVPPKPVRTPATTKGEPAFKRRRLAPPTPDSNAEVPTEEVSEDPIEDFDDYELPTSNQRNAFTELTSSQRKGAAPMDWQPAEDRVVLKGMQQGWSAKKVLSQLPNSRRTESAVRGRRAVLKRKYPDKASRSPVATPSRKEIKTWSDDEVSKLRLGRAGGLDNRAIHERYFSRDRSLEAVNQKLRRLEDLGVIPSSSASAASTQPVSSPAEAALARRQPPPQVEPEMRTAYVQLPAREEVEARTEKVEHVQQTKPQTLAASPRVQISTQQKGIFRDQPESERWRICMAQADGDEEKAKRYREDLQDNMDMINAVTDEDQDMIENIKVRRIQRRLRRAITDGRARRKNRRTPRSKTLVPSTEAADEEVLRESDWEITEEEDVADTNGDIMNFGDEEPGNDDDISEDEVEDMVRDRQIEEVEESDEEEGVGGAQGADEGEQRAVINAAENRKVEDDHEESESKSDSGSDEENHNAQAANDLALLEMQLSQATPPVTVEVPSSNAIQESEQSTDDSAMSVRTDESRNKSKSDAKPQDVLADDKAPQKIETPSTSSTNRSTPGKLPSLRQHMQGKTDGHGYAPPTKSPSSSNKARPSPYDVPTSEKKARTSTPRLAATAAFVGTLGTMSREREALLKKKDWMPPPPKRRDPDEFLPKRKANGDPLWFESDDAESSSSSDSD